MKATIPAVDEIRVRRGPGVHPHPQQRQMGGAAGRRRRDRAVQGISGGSHARRRRRRARERVVSAELYAALAARGRVRTTSGSSASAAALASSRSRCSSRRGRVVPRARSAHGGAQRRGQLRQLGEHLATTAFAQGSGGSPRARSYSFSVSRRAWVRTTTTRARRSRTTSTATRRTRRSRCTSRPTRTNYFADVSFNFLLAHFVAEIGRVSGGDVTTFNTFSTAASAARTYGSLGIRIGL